MKRRRPQKIIGPLKRVLPEIFLMTFHLNSHGTNDIKPEMLSGVQTGNGTPHDKCNICGIARAHKQKRRHFHAKTTSAKLYYYIGVRSRDLFIDKAHTVLDIFPACCLVRFASFFGKIKILSPKMIWFTKILSPNNILSKKSLDPKRCWVQKVLIQQNVWSKLLDPKNL